MRKCGLPTFPIADGMRIGDRDLEELIWLLVHGYFINSPIASYLKIETCEEGYVVISGSHERHLEGEVRLLGPMTISQLLKSKRIQPALARWQWFSKNLPADKEE